MGSAETEMQGKEVKLVHDLDPLSAPDVAEQSEVIPELREARLSLLHDLRDCRKLLQETVDDLRRFETGHEVSLPSANFIKEVGKNHPNDVEIQEELRRLQNLETDLNRLQTLAYNQQLEFQDKFDELVRKLNEAIKDSFLQTAAYFEKLAVLSVALVGASISGIVALVAHLPPGRALSGQNQIYSGLIFYLSALAIALIGQLSARFQSHVQLSDLVKLVERTGLKRSAFVYLHDRDKRAEEYKRIDRETGGNRIRRFKMSNHLILFLTHSGSFVPAIGCIIMMLLGIWSIFEVFMVNLTAVPIHHVPFFRI